MTLSNSHTVLSSGNTTRGVTTPAAEAPPPPPPEGLLPLADGEETAAEPEADGEPAVVSSSADDGDAYIPMTLGLFFENMRKFLNQEPLLNPVNREFGY